MSCRPLCLFPPATQNPLGKQPAHFVDKNHMGHKTTVTESLQTCLSQFDALTWRS